MLLVTLLAWGLSGAVRAGNSEPSPRITVNGEGTAELVPDMAVLQLSVTRDADTARQALDANSAAMAQVIKALREQGIAERDIQTANFGIQPRYVYPQPRAQGEREPPRIVGYTVRNGLNVRVRDLAKLGAIIDQSVTLGVNEGGNIMFTNDDPSAAIDKARASAVRDAMGRAKTLASAAGVKLGRLLELSENSYNIEPAPMMRAEMMASAAADAAPPVAAGENSYQVRVSASYAIVQ
ncbi:MAG: SIMPL domain-containing protein [Halieaceae bacterium]|nr:SIMPL domain-containing protein [Halieaceae bacterium]